MMLHLEITAFIWLSKYYTEWKLRVNFRIFQPICMKLKPSGF